MSFFNVILKQKGDDVLFSKTEIEKNKIDAYELCPCGSKKKFRFCCYQKAREARHKESAESKYTDQRINHMARQNWEKADFKTCMGFDKNECNSVIKGAHSIQNNRFLNRISKDGHVYQIKGEISKQKGPYTIFNRISRNKASTFFGFCDYHDTELFKPIELTEYKEEPIQNFLFAFRASALEYHRKQRFLNNLHDNFKKFPAAMLDPISVNMYRVALLDIQDYENDYNQFKTEHEKGEFENLRTVCKVLEYEVEFTTSSAFTVQYDYNRKQINDIYHDKSDKKMPSIYVSVYPVEDKTIIILSYHLSDKDIYEEYFNQLEGLTNEEIVQHLNYIIIEYTENVYFSPDLVDRMADEQKDSLLRSFSSSVNILEKFELSIEQNYYTFNIFNPQSTQ